MNLAWITVAAVGGAALAAAAIGVLLAAVVEPQRPDLGAVLQRIHRPTAQAVSSTDRAVAWASTRLRLPLADLSILSRTPSQYLAAALLAGGAGALFPALAAWAFNVVGVAVPALGTAVAVPVCAAAMVAGAHHDMRTKAKAARIEFDRAIAVYAELVAGQLSAARGPVQALEDAARVADTWVFDRIIAALREADSQMHLPWQRLRVLAADVSSAALADLAQIMESAGERGTDATATLHAHAAGLRDGLGAAEKARANAVNTKMQVPGALAVLIFTAWLIFPYLLELMFQI